jgi:basic amino acid/polyamine antiporter, APA family
VLPIDQIRASKLVAADVGQRVMGPAGVVFVAITVMLSTFGSLNSTMLANPRVFFAMAEDGLFFKPIAAVHPRFKTPVNAIALAAVLGVTFVLLRKFEDLADAFVTAILPFYIMGVAAIFVLRRRPGYSPAFRTPGYPIVPTLFILATLYLLVNAVIDPSTRWPTIAVFGVIALGIPVYYATVGRRVAPPDSTRRTASETA